MRKRTLKRIGSVSCFSFWFIHVHAFRQFQNTSFHHPSLRLLGLPSRISQGIRERLVQATAGVEGVQIVYG